MTWFQLFNCQTYKSGFLSPSWRNSGLFFLHGPHFVPTEYLLELAAKAARGLAGFVNVGWTK